MKEALRMLTEIQRIMRDMDMKKRNGGEAGEGTANNFRFMYFQKRLGQVFLPNIKYIFAYHSYNILPGIIIFCREILIPNCKRFGSQGIDVKKSIPVQQIGARIFKRLWSRGIDSKSM